MSRIQFQIADRVLTVDEPRVVRIGRSGSSDITLDAPGISRRHAELRPTPAGWQLHDCSSSNGTWVNGQRIGDVILGPRTAVHFGAPDAGVEATITIEQHAVVAPEPADQPSKNETLIYSMPSSKGQPSGILVRTRAGDNRFAPESKVRIGREAGLEIVADDPFVSRKHAIVEHRRGGWYYVDHSQSGSYVGGERIREKKLTEPTTVHLGHPTAGYEVELVPMVDVSAAQKKITGKRRRTMAIRLAAIVGVLVLLAGGGVAAWFLHPWRQTNPPAPSSSGLSAANLERAKRASVQIAATNADGKKLWTGSGTIISADGLILTNAHVGNPSVFPVSHPEHKSDAAVYLVGFTKDDASPAQSQYRAKPIVGEGYLDLAVMKIYAKADGSSLPATLGLPEPVPIGDSNALRTGDHITALGYPALTMSNNGLAPLTVTSGDVAAFEEGPPQIDRFWIDSTARTGSGNSGGATINNAGELIGINSMVVAANISGKGGDVFTSGSTFTRPVALASDVIRVARNGGDPNYVSPYFAKLPQLSANATAKSAGWSKSSSSDCSGSSTEQNPQTLQGVSAGNDVIALFSVTGVPDTTPFTFTFLANDKKTVLSESRGEWRNGQDQVCLRVSLTVTAAGLQGGYGVLTLGGKNELKATNPVKFG